MTDLEKKSQPKKKKRTTRDIITYTVGSTVRQLVGFIMLPIYTTYLKPEDYGVVALLTMSIAIFELVLGARFAQAVPRFYYEEDTKNGKNTLLSTALSTTGIVSLIGVVLIWLAREPFSFILFGSIDNAHYIALFAVLLFTSGVERYGMTFLRILEKPIAFVSASLLKFIIQLSLNIYLVVMLDWGVQGVIIGSVVSSLIFCIFFAALIYTKCGFKMDFSVIKKLFIFTWPLWLAGSSAIYINSSNRFFIRMFGGLDDVGLFELAVRFSAILGILVWEPFSFWWQTERFKILKYSKNYKDEFQQIFDIVISIMIGAIAGIVILGGPTIEVMSAIEFHEASAAIAPLTFSIFFFKLSQFFNFNLMVKDKTVVISYLKYGLAFVTTALFLTIIPRFGFVGAAYAMLFANILLFVATYRWGRRYLDLEINFSYLNRVLLLVVIVVLLDSITLIEGSFIKTVGVKIALLVLFWACGLYLLAKNPSTSKIVHNSIDFIKSKLF